MTSEKGQKLYWKNVERRRTIGVINGGTPYRNSEVHESILEDDVRGRRYKFLRNTPSMRDSSLVCLHEGQTVWSRTRIKVGKLGKVDILSKKIGNLKKKQY